MGENNIDLCETHILGPDTRELIVGQQSCPALGQNGLGLTGLSWAKSPFHFARPRPERSQVLACISGWGQVWTEDGWTRCEPEMAYLSPAAAPHRYRAVGGVRWEFAWVMSQQGEDAALLIRAERPTLVRADPRPLVNAIGGLYRETMGAGEAAVLHHWAGLVGTYARRIAGQERGDGRLSALWQTVDTHLSHPWSIDELAARAGTCGEHLRRLCRGQTGRSPMRHVTHLRMRRAAALLSSQAFTVEAVAQQVGYGDAFAFSTAFKRHLGVSPSEYRDRKTAR